MRRTLFAAVATAGGLALASGALVQAAEPQPDLVAGKVESVTASELTISSQGLKVSFHLTPQTEVMVSRAGKLSDIKPGSFLGTTNTATGAASGDSTEVHIFPPGVKMGEGDRPMGGPQASTRMTNGTVSSTGKGPATGGTRMTNGSVGAVAKASSSVTMDVAYAGGHRKVVVTSSTPIVVLTSIKATKLTPGSNVLVGAVPGPDKERTASFVNVQP